jgi:ABC-type polar amino acid transport system ATPase subunit
MTALAKDGMTMVVVTSRDGALPDAPGDRVVFMSDGQLVEEAPARRVLRRPAQ